MVVGLKMNADETTCSGIQQQQESCNQNQRWHRVWRSQQLQVPRGMDGEYWKRHLGVAFYFAKALSPSDNFEMSTYAHIMLVVNHAISFILARTIHVS